MIDRLQQQAGAQMFNKFRPQMEALATVVARRERAQLDLAQRLVEASDVDVETGDLPEVEERADELEAMAEAAANQDLQTWYFETFAPDHLENPERAAAYAGFNGDEWKSQKQAWAENYRKTSPEAEAYSDDELAGLHVENTFGVSLEEFEQNVIDWSPGEAIETVLTVHLTTVEATMQAVARDLEDDGGEDDE